MEYHVAGKRLTGGMRACSEINDFEAQLAQADYVLAKFWLAICKVQAASPVALRWGISITFPNS